MVKIAELETQLVTALKAHDEVRVRTMRLLLSRLKNEQIAAGQPLTEAQIQMAIQSEVKRRREAAAEFLRGGRADSAAAENQEAAVLAEFLPAQADRAAIEAVTADLIAQNAWTKADFGSGMKALKEKFGATADGALLSTVLKEKLI